MKEKATTSNFSLGIRFVCTQSRPEKKCHFYVSSIFEKFRHSFLKLLIGLEILITVLRCADFKTIFMSVFLRNLL